jgi:hypothetical protein
VYSQAQGSELTAQTLRNELDHAHAQADQECCLRLQAEERIKRLEGLLRQAWNNPIRVCTTVCSGNERHLRCSGPYTSMLLCISSGSASQPASCTLQSSGEAETENLQRAPVDTSPTPERRSMDSAVADCDSLRGELAGWRAACKQLAIEVPLTMTSMPVYDRCMGSAEIFNAA